MNFSQAKVSHEIGDKLRNENIFIAKWKIWYYQKLIILNIISIKKLWRKKMSNILKAFINITRNPIINLIDYYQGRNRINYNAPFFQDQ